MFRGFRKPEQTEISVFRKTRARAKTNQTRTPRRGSRACSSTDRREAKKENKRVGTRWFTVRAFVRCLYGVGTGREKIYRDTDERKSPENSLDSDTDNGTRSNDCYR